MGYAPPPAYAQHPQAGYGYPGVNPMASKADVSAHKPGLRMWFLICAGGTLACFVLGALSLMIGAISGDPDVFAIFGVIGYLLMLASTPFYIAKLVIGMMWLHAAWRWVPPDMRYDNTGKPIRPDQVFYLLIPYFQYYWMFPINGSLCFAMDRMRAERFPQAMTTSNPDTAMWAAICQFIPFGVFVSPFLWASYMKRIDTMHGELQALGA